MYTLAVKRSSKITTLAYIVCKSVLIDPIFHKSQCHSKQGRLQLKDL